MKLKILISFSIIYLFAGGSFAQSYLGIYAGPYSGRFSGDSPNNSTYTGKLGYVIGLNYDIPIKDDVYISVLPAFVNTGAKLSFLDSARENYQDSITFSFQFISLPIEMKIISDNKRFQFSGGLEMIIPLQLYGETDDERIDMKGDINDLGIGVLFGIGYRIPINKNFLLLDLIYSQGLLNMADNLGQDNSYLPRVKFNSIKFTATWNIMLGKKTN